MRLRERIAFLRQMRSSFEYTGAIQPSSRSLACAMVAPLLRTGARERAGAIRILEIGPGTGAVTRAIAAAMGAHDRLVCYEINPEFVDYLSAALVQDPLFVAVAGRIEIRAADAREVPPEPPFDAAMCSAPLNNFDAATAAAILDAALAALAPGGRLTFFEYLGLPRLRGAFSGATTRRRIADVDETKRARLARYGRGSTTVWANLPPARVHELAR